MREILLLGAGKIGSLIAELLCDTGDYRVTVIDRDQERLNDLPCHPQLLGHCLDISKPETLHAQLQGKYAVLSACPFAMTIPIATAAIQEQVHYLDLTEDISSTRTLKELALHAKSAVIPQCGLAPGFINIATHEQTRHFDKLRDVHMRVGALPKYPSNALKYNLTWSTEGLINQYCNPCEAIIEGELTTVHPLEGVETFSLDGVNYEAFNTSGGVGSLCETLAGNVINLNYRTVRYPGHRDVMKMLLQDLRLMDRRDLLIEILEAALPVTYQDVVLVFISVSGMQHGQLVQETYANKIYNRRINGRLRSAIQITTAAGICAVLDLLAAGKAPQTGFVRQEQIRLNDLLNNRFGNYYRRSDPVPQCRPGENSQRAG